TYNNIPTLDFGQQITVLEQVNSGICTNLRKRLLKNYNTLLARKSRVIDDPINVGFIMERFR
ncbi:hypothetical protein, partial [Novosphingobium rosa]|uniref:hypothetical protein n=1 Tax=Novosphingobium rosa TaxID=76978 RepID=UPI001C3F7D90